MGHHIAFGCPPHTEEKEEKINKICQLKTFVLQVRTESLQLYKINR